MALAVNRLLTLVGLLVCWRRAQLKLVLYTPLFQGCVQMNNPTKVGTLNTCSAAALCIYAAKL